MEHMQMEQRNGIYGELHRGRYPFAAANMKGTVQYPSVGGRIAFYTTPLGVLISAEFYGLPTQNSVRRMSGIYEVCLEDEGSALCTNGHSSCMMLPTLYEKNGYAWCSYLTRKIAFPDLEKRKIALRAHLNQDSCIAVACGILQTASREKREILETVGS